jgi:hypothetical protein
MINMAAKKGLLFPEIRKHLKTSHDMTLVKDGRGAALATLACMRDVATTLPPVKLINAYEKSFVDGTPHTQALWDAFADETGEVMALGARTLAMIWDSAWKQGGGRTDSGRRKPADLRALYENANFVRSVTVDEIEHEIANPKPLNGGATGASATASSARGTALRASANRAGPKRAAKKAPAKKKKMKAKKKRAKK